MTTKFLLPAGDADVIDRLELDGRFSLNEARFSNVNVQQQINTLSQRGKGEETRRDGPSVVSQLSGTFSECGRRHTHVRLFVFRRAGRGRADCRHLRHQAGACLIFAATCSSTPLSKKTNTRLEGCGPQNLRSPCSADRAAGSKLPMKITGSARKPEIRTGCPPGGQSRLALAGPGRTF